MTATPDAGGPTGRWWPAERLPARMPRRGGRRGEEGFSLIEVLVAITLFGAVLMGFTGVLISTVRSVGEQRSRTAATRVVTGHLETLRSLPGDQLDLQAPRTTVTTPEGRTFTVDTVVTPIDASTGAAAPGARVRQVTATVGWTFRGATRSITTTTAMTPVESSVAVARAIGTVTMFPSPATVDLFGTPVQDIDVTVPLQGFASGTLVYLSWPNAGMADGAQTLTVGATGLNWRGLIPRARVRAAVGLDGKGSVTFTVTAGNLSTLYTLAVQKSVLIPPVIVTATVDRIPVTVAKAANGKTCADANQCQNMTDVVFTVTATGLNASQGDSIILQFQLYDGSFQELPLTPSGLSWVVTIRQKTTKFLVGTDRPFRFTAIRTADSGTASRTVLDSVVAI